MEIWKGVLGYENHYEVSNNGVIRNSKNRRVLKGSIHSSGYVYVTFTVDNEVSSHRVHRIVAIAFCDDRLWWKNVVNHKDGIKTNNHPSNLEWITHKENVIHSRRSGLNKSKLSEKDVVEIREMFSQGVSKRELGFMYGVTESNINAVIKRKTFKYLA